MKTNVVTAAATGVLISWGTLGCAGSEGDEAADNGSGGASSDAMGGGSEVELDAPDTADALVPWLEAGNYKDWLAEPEYHESSGPHGNAVKVFYSDQAVASLAAGNLDLAPGSAVVKELTSGGSLYGWGVYVRGRDLDGNAGVYFYELIKPSQVYGDAYNSGECTGCHTGRALILSDLEMVGF